jgi:putative membrane protein
MQKKLLLIIPAIILVLSGFFVVYFSLRPEALPFPFWIFQVISQLTNVLIALPILYGLSKWCNWRQDWWKILIIFIYPLLIESFAIVTGWPYSNFVYGEVLGNLKVFGLVPWTVSLSWVPIFFFSLILVSRLGIKRMWLKILVGAILMTTFDLILDPGATALGFWVWEIQGWYYGVPLMNFFGWMVTSLLAFWGFYLLFPKRKSLDNNIAYWLSLSGLWSLVFWIGIAGWLGFWWLVVAGVGYWAWVNKRLNIHSIFAKN